MNNKLVGYYINLNKRSDRKEHFENLKKEYSFLSNIERMEAIYSDSYGVGCLLSHIKCLQNFLESDNKQEYYAVFEDDYCILNKENFIEFINEFDKIKDNSNWDIITLTPRGKTIQKNKINNFHKIIDSRTTTGYIIKHSFLEILLKNYKENVIKLMKGYNGPDPNPYVADQCWKVLQEKYKFLYFHKIYGGQLPSYSDIEKQYVDYNQRFLQQVYF